MSEFVKVHGPREQRTTFIRISEIVGFHNDQLGETQVWLRGEKSPWYSEETPEQIMALIDGPADRDALVEALRKIVLRSQSAELSDALDTLSTIYWLATSALDNAVKS
jgi:hypothetical protein